MELIEPKFIACLIDMSHCCEKAFLERCGGKLYMSGFYDDSTNTYICSAEKMVFVHALEWVPEEFPEDEDDKDALYNELEDAPPEAAYFARYDIDAMRESAPKNFVPVDIELDPDDDPAEYVLEILQGNPIF